MRVFSREEVCAATPWPALIDAVEDAFRTACVAPVRAHFDVASPGEPDATLLLMPAWRVGAALGVKVATVFPGAASRGLPAVNASYMLFDARDGVLTAVLDGGELTARRTAAASAAAARRLARPDAARLLVVGTGRLSLNLAEAHAAALPLQSVTFWGRSPEKAAAVAAAAQERGMAANAAADLEAAVADADVISVATLSETPLIRGGWLKPGQHLDLVGAFKPSMRESDDAVMRRADLVAVDTRDGAFKEAGDIVQAFASGALTEARVAADLFDLATGLHPGRAGPEQITVFKSVGAALEDLAAALLATGAAASPSGA